MSTFESSDSIRSARPLKHARRVVFGEPVVLELGGQLDGVTAVYETYGTLNAARDNAILICHALSGDSHVTAHDDADDPGWWDIAVGPGKAIDTNKYFVICPNVLGGCRGTTGPGSTNPLTGRPYGADFPTITAADIAEVQHRVVTHLGVDRLLAAVGGSMGGHQVLAWATKFPDQVRGAIALATSPRLTIRALAFDVVGRNAIIRDPNFCGGQYYDSNCVPGVGLALARMLGHITYLSPQAMTEKFEADRLQPKDLPTVFEKKFSVGSYLAYQGHKFVERFDANSYITLSLAMDLFDLGSTPAELAQSLARSTCRWMVVSFTSDWLFPSEQSREVVDTLLSLGKPVSYCNVASGSGHDAFLLPEDLPVYGEIMRAFLANLSNGGNGTGDEDEDVYLTSPTSIFHTHRLDYDRIVSLIPPSSSVLDLGCGRGRLLQRLKKTSGRLMGLELEEGAVVSCMQRGLNVVHADLNHGLAPFGDRQFDYVVLSQTLQAVRNVELVINGMLRVGRRCVVSFPNFAYHKLRRMLYEQGKAPESPGLLRYKWYDSPNIRFFTIVDFEDFCKERGIKIHQRIALDTEEGKEVVDDPNGQADTAIFVLSK